MYDPQTLMTIAIAIYLGFFAIVVICLLYGLYLLGRIRKQAVGINQRLDQLLARRFSGGESAGGSGMSL